MALGINRRNALISRENPRSALRLVRDKLATKECLARHGVPVPPTLAVMERLADVDARIWARLPDSWVMKPQRGSRGRGVLVVVGRSGGAGEPAWVRADGVRCAASDAAAHASAILDGEFTGGVADGAMIEPLLQSHPELAGFAPAGLPDVRVISHRGVPLLAMLRLPTAQSGGRGNLHQGGIGAAVDLSTGVVYRAVHEGCLIERHPDTGAQLVGAVVPLWREVVAAAAASGPATGLGYAGTDLVIDGDLGVVVLEVNGHPGLEIQNVCAVSLHRLLSNTSLSRLV